TIGDYSATIDWGDGSVVTSGLTVPGAVFGQHTYREEGTYTVTVVVFHDTSVPTVATATATVADAPLTGSGTTSMVQEGTPFSGPVATFVDTGVLGEPNAFDPGAIAAHYTATIDFGDGTGAFAATITQIGTSNAYTVTPAVPHTYAEDGVF